MSDLIGKIDNLVSDPRWRPYAGWSNAGAMAAFQQVRYEFIQFVNVLDEHELYERCLQLGLGLSGCSQAVWQTIFVTAITIDDRHSFIGNKEIGPLNTHHKHAFLEEYTPFDLLFIDAGHIYEDVKQDYDDYSPLVRKGGIIAFHDAIHRPQYDSDHHVWRYLADHRPGINIIGTEVGIAWMIKE